MTIYDSVPAGTFFQFGPDPVPGPDPVLELKKMVSGAPLQV
jgi:hypothetical protein